MPSRSTATALLLAAVQAALLLATAWDKSDTVDEPTYLAVAALISKHGDLGYNPEAPALPKRAFGSALSLVGAIPPDLPREPRSAEEALLWRSPPESLRITLLTARATTVVVVVLAGLALFRLGESFAPGVGLLAQALWAASPTVLASGSLATLDAWAAAMLAFALAAAALVLERPTPLRGAALGAFLGLAAACKVPTLGAAPIAAACLLALHGRRSARALGAAAVAGGLALWAVYGFHFGPALLPSRELTFPLPFPEWWTGLFEQMAHGARGHRSYLFGETSRTGWWWFYLAALALKTTLGAQGLFALGLAASWRRFRSGSRLLVDVALFAYPLLLLLVMSAGRTQNGIKYLLPAFPFAILWLALQWQRVREAFGRRAQVAVLALAALGAVESIRVHPHHLMFFNLWAGGPEGGPRYLIVGDDWGQDQRRLGEWQRDNQIPVIYYTRYTSHPEAWGIRSQDPPCSLERADDTDTSPRRGYYALQAVEVHRPRRIEAGCLDWLTALPPDDRIGWSIYLYAVDRQKLETLRQGVARPFWKSGG